MSPSFGWIVLFGYSLGERYIKEHDALFAFSIDIKCRIINLALVKFLLLCGFKLRLFLTSVFHLRIFILRLLGQPTRGVCGTRLMPTNQNTLLKILRWPYISPLLCPTPGTIFPLLPVPKCVSKPSFNGSRILNLQIGSVFRATVLAIVPFKTRTCSQ